MSQEAITYDRGELRGILRSFRAMDDEAIAQARTVSNRLATEAADRIKTAAGTRRISAIAAQRIAYGVRVSKSSKIGEFSYGFTTQRFSGGATTQTLWPGMEFGSNRYKQFPNRTPSQGKGNAGYFIYPTLREMQPYLIAQWENAFSDIVKEWDRF